jgi:hypothetical protein
VIALWSSSFKALLQRGASWQVKEEANAGEVTSSHESRDAFAPPQASSHESAELSRYFRDEHGRMHILL